MEPLQLLLKILFRFRLCRAQPPDIPKLASPFEATS